MQIPNEEAMEIGIAVTNYNNSDLTEQLVRSLESAATGHKVIVVIVDNNSCGEEKAKLEKLNSDSLDLKILFNSENLGYFAGLNIGIEAIRKIANAPDYVIVGNNDLFFGRSFFSNLSLVRKRSETYAVISPDLVTLDGVHQNPHVTKPISGVRKTIWRLYYSNYTISQIVLFIANRTKKYTNRKDSEAHRKPGPILLGYGACYILTPLFFKVFDRLWAPTFLMGEEYFFAKQLASEKMQIYYEPSLQVTHHDHATIGKLPSKELWNISRDSFRTYLRFSKTHGPL